MLGYLKNKIALYISYFLLFLNSLNMTSYIITGAYTMPYLVHQTCSQCVGRFYHAQAMTKQEYHYTYYYLRLISRQLIFKYEVLHLHLTSSIIESF